jgi:glycosyltransferase involved in cell wall biosynthesis
MSEILKKILRPLVLKTAPAVRRFLLPRSPLLYTKIANVGRPLFLNLLSEKSTGDNDWLLWRQDISSKVNCNEVLIVVRDIVMPDRATSYLRLQRIIDYLIATDKKVCILVLNSVDTQKAIWGLSDIQIDSYTNRIVRAGASVLVAPSQSQLLGYLTRFPHIWLHDLKVAQDFLRLVAQKIPFRQIIFDTVDLSFRRALSRDDYEEEIRMYRVMSHFADKVLTISQEEFEICRTDLKIDPDKLHTVSIIYPEFKNIKPRFGSALYDAVFVGNFLHHPNLDAIHYLCDEIAPGLRNVQIAIVGPNLPHTFKARLNKVGIQYLGYVHDIEFVYEKTKVVIAPLRLGAGVKGKVVEALNLGIPVVTTEIGAQGISNLDKSNFTVLDSTTALVNYLNKLASEPLLTCNFNESELAYLNATFGPSQLQEVSRWIS